MKNDIMMAGAILAYLFLQARQWVVLHAGEFISKFMSIKPTIKWKYTPISPLRWN